jgi:hypothetical protein
MEDPAYNLTDAKKYDEQRHIWNTYRQQSRHMQMAQFNHYREWYPSGNPKLFELNGMRHIYRDDDQHAVIASVDISLISTSWGSSSSSSLSLVEYPTCRRTVSSELYRSAANHAQSNVRLDDFLSGDSTIYSKEDAYSKISKSLEKIASLGTVTSHEKVVVINSGEYSVAHF